MKFIVFTATVYIVQCFCVVCGVYCGLSNSSYSAKLLCCVEFFFGYSNSRYSVLVLCCVWIILWLQQQ